jgi:hypothetical protein
MSCYMLISYWIDNVRFVIYGLISAALLSTACYLRLYYLRTS